jgi:hypothetical protein
MDAALYRTYPQDLQAVVLAFTYALNKSLAPLITDAVAATFQFTKLIRTLEAANQRSDQPSTPVIMLTCSKI